MKLQPEDAWILGILVTALQREVEVPGHVPGLLVLQLEHLRVGGGARNVVLHPLLLLHAVGDVELEEGDAGPQGCGNDELPRPTSSLSPTLACSTTRTPLKSVHLTVFFFSLTSLLCTP